MKETLRCHCGGICLRLEKDELYIIQSKKLVIKQVPYYKCSSCKKEFKISSIKKQIKFIEQNFAQQAKRGIVNEVTECKFYHTILNS